MVFIEKCVVKYLQRPQMVSCRSSDFLNQTRNQRRIHLAAPAYTKPYPVGDVLLAPRDASKGSAFRSDDVAKRHLRADSFPTTASDAFPIPI